jgi:hypothetical protein
VSYASARSASNYVAAITYYDPDAAAERVLLVASTGFSTSGTSTPPHTTVEPRVVTPATVRRDLFDVGTTGGASRVGYGELLLRNDDGGLDWLGRVSVDGRPVRLYVADTPAAEFPGGYTLLLEAVAEQPELTLAEARVRLRDRQTFTTGQLQATKFAGTNVLPNGLEGIASDLQGKPKPVLYGWCFNVAPVLVNTSRLIWQVNDGPVRDVMAVYDSGALLSRGPDYADATQLQSVQPAAGSFRVWKGGGFFRLGSTPVGQVTCDAVEGLWPQDRTAAQVFQRLLVERAGLAPGDISAADVAALDQLQPATVGLYVAAETTVAEALDLLAQSVGAWWGADENGVLRIQRLDAPTGPPVLLLDGDRIKSGALRRVPLSRGGLPAYRVTVRCAPNWTVQTNGLAGSVSAARRARLAQPFQDAVVEDPAVQAQHLLAPELVVETLLACRTDGAAEAARLLGLYGVQRERYEVTVRLPGAALAQVQLGAVVELRYSRFGLQDGKLMRVLGFQLDPVAGEATLTLWG